MLKESNIKEIENLISEAIKNVYKENSEEPSPTYEWDLTEKKVKDSTLGVKTIEQAKQYLNILFKKIKNLPKKIKLKILKYAFISLAGIMSYSQLYDYASNSDSGLDDEIEIIKLDLTANNAEEDSPDVMDLDSKEDEEESVDEEVILSHIPSSISDSLIDFMKIEEGSAKFKGEPVLVAYDLGDDMITIGWGHAESKSNSQFKVGDTIKLEKAKELLLQDLNSAEKAVKSVFEEWKGKNIPFYVDQNMYDAMVSMTFNMGRGGFRGSDFIQLVKKGNYEEAKERILSTNVSYPGHIKRRKKESEMFGKSLDSNPLVVDVEKSKNIISESHKKRLKKLAGIM
jgi:GH24 family phage-related lysozyme (muramidase)